MSCYCKSSLTFPRGAVGCSVLCDCSSSDHTHLLFLMAVAISTCSINKLNGFSPLYFLKAQHFQSVYKSYYLPLCHVDLV